MIFHFKGFPKCCLWSGLKIQGEGIRSDKDRENDGEMKKWEESTQLRTKLESTRARLSLQRLKWSGAFHFSLTPLQSAHELSLWRKGICCWGDMWRGWPPKAICPLHTYTHPNSGIKSCTEVISGRASVSTTEKLPYFKEVGNSGAETYELWIWVSNSEVIIPCLSFCINDISFGKNEQGNIYLV